MRPILFPFLLVSLLALAGCGHDTSETADSSSSTNSSDAAAAMADAGPSASLPDGFFLTESPSGAVPLSQARDAAAPGDKIVFTGYIGGRVEPFTEGRAVFLVADAVNAPRCVPDHGCPTPWDACCVPGETVAANSASVRVVDADGHILKVGLNGRGGLAPGREVTVKGTVKEANDAVFLVDANALAVK